MPIPLVMLGILEMATLRTLVMAVISGAAWELGSAAVEKLFDTIVTKLRGANNTDEDSAWVELGEWILGLLGGSLALFLALRGRLPVRIADKLGLVLKKKPGAVKIATVADISANAAKGRGFSLDTVQTVLKYIGGFVGTSSLAMLAISQWIDFGNWNSGAYQGTFNKLFAVFGLKPDEHYASPKVQTQEAFDKVFTILKNEGATTIIEPETGKVMPFERENVVIVTDWIAGKMVLEKGKALSKEVLAAALALTDIPTKKGGPGGTFSPLLPTSTAAGSAPLGTVPTQIKIYTGVVSNGTLGTPQEFVARPDDMIQNADELKAAAKNNLAALYQALPGRFYYEIAVVASVRTRAGFTVKGAPVQVVSGYKKDGTPRYKTIYHKFAIMRIFVTDWNGRNVKLQEITLGPVNVVDFQPTPAQLSDVASKITPETFTGDVKEVKQIITTQPVTVTSQTPANPAPASSPAGGTATQPNTAGTQQPAASTPATPPPAPTPVQVSSPAPAPAPVAPSLTAQQLKIKAASNLSEFYAALGQDLPPLNMRANYYAANGLGAASTYAGTAEQNARLLAFFKSQAGVG